MHSEIIKALTAKLGQGTFQTNGDLGVRLLPDGDWQPVSAHLSASEIAAADAALEAGKQAQRIKDECRRRIVSIIPEHKQRNVLAKGFEMVMAYGPDPSQWPAEAQQLASDTLATWAEIERLRAKSNELEQNPPANIRDDAAWDA